MKLPSGIPTMYAASGYELLSQLRHGGVSEDWGALGVAFIVSAITAFAICRIVFGIALLALVPASGA